MPYPRIPTVITVNKVLLEVFVIGGFQKIDGSVWLVYQVQGGPDPQVYFRPAPLETCVKTVPPLSRDTPG